jgi:hypothetical protein
MENTTKGEKFSHRHLHYYRQRLKNRVFAALTEFFVAEAAGGRVTKKLISERLNRDPAQITRWLNSPGNLTLETLSDLLFAMEAEVDPPKIASLRDRLPTRYEHPLIAKIVANSGGPLPPSLLVGSETASNTATILDLDRWRSRTLPSANFFSIAAGS